MLYEKKILQNGNSLSILIPSDVAKWLELEVGTPIVLKVETGRHGKFVSFWKDEE